MRITSVIVVGYIFLNGWVNLLARNDFYESIGAGSVQLPSDHIEDFLDFGVLQTGGSSGAENIFALTASAVGWFTGGAVDMVLGLPVVLVEVGVPGWFVGLVTLPLSYIMIKEMWYVFTQRDL